MRNFLKHFKTLLQVSLATNKFWWYLYSELHWSLMTYFHMQVYGDETCNRKCVVMEKKETPTHTHACMQAHAGHIYVYVCIMCVIL